MLITMKKCKFDIEAFFGIPFDYENWYESMIVELTDEQFDRYCEALRRWQATDIILIIISSNFRNHITSQGFLGKVIFFFINI